LWIVWDVVKDDDGETFGYHIKVALACTLDVIGRCEWLEAGLLSWGKVRVLGES
jgi:hypothetical protein